MLLLALLLLQAPKVTLLRAADAEAPVRIERVSLAHKEVHTIGANETVILYSLDGRATDDKGTTLVREDALYASGTSVTLQAEKSARMLRFTLQNAAPQTRHLYKKTRAVSAHSIAANKGTARIVFATTETGEPSWVFDILDVDGGAVVPTHKHDDAVEIIVVVSGSAITVVDGTMSTAPVATIAKGALHSAKFPTKTRALQIYAPAGPEQRFRN